MTKLSVTIYPVTPLMFCSIHVLISWFIYKTFDVTNLIFMKKDSIIGYLENSLGNKLPHYG